MTIPILIKTSEINEMLCINTGVSMKTIVDYVCFEYGITLADLIKRDKARPLPDARHLIFYIAYKKDLGTAEAIGHYLQRDHATVLHGMKKIRNLYEVDSEIRNRVDKMQFMFNI